MSINLNQFDSLGRAAIRLAQQLQEQDWRIVFAESCTAGLVAASMARVPGISHWMCGSAVTYQEETKQAWLSISSADLEQFSAVSKVVTGQMATHVLEKTPLAKLSTAVTGHLGPNAPQELDGIGFVAVAMRVNGQIISENVSEFRMTQSERVARQFESARFVLEYVAEFIADRSAAMNGDTDGNT